MKRLSVTGGSRSSVLQNGLVHSAPWSHADLPDLNEAAREAHRGGSFLKSPVVLWIPLTKLLCLRPIQPCAQGIGQTTGLTLRYLSAATQPAVTCAASIPVVEYVDPVSAVYTAFATVSEYVASAPVNEYVGYAPVIEQLAPTSAVTIRVPVKQTMSLRVIANRPRCEQRKLPPSCRAVHVPLFNHSTSLDRLVHCEKCSASYPQLTRKLVDASAICAHNTCKVALFSARAKVYCGQGSGTFVQQG